MVSRMPIRLTMVRCLFAKDHVGKHHARRVGNDADALLENDGVSDDLQRDKYPLFFGDLSWSDPMDRLASVVLQWRPRR